MCPHRKQTQNGTLNFQYSIAPTILCHNNTKKQDTVKHGYNDHGYNEFTVITNKK